jgi:hypothetical protein
VTGNVPPKAQHLQIGQVLRYSRTDGPNVPLVGSLSNFWHATSLPGTARVQLEKGINPIAPVLTVTGLRRPAILISSSPHRVGSAETPWHDIFDPDNGHIRYFGDAKTPSANPALAPGNKALLEAHQAHSAIDPVERLASVPIVFFRRTTVDGVRKGFVQFQGLGVIERAERITQSGPKGGLSFTNYVYDAAVLALSDENELFDWTWINRRRDPALSDNDCHKYAPAAWQRWLKQGPSSIARNRRRASKLLVTRPKEQLPSPGSKAATNLNEIVRYYETRKHRFEGLAYAIARKLLSGAGGRFVDGWITPAGGDGGADFIGRFDVGLGFGAVRQIVYGQAKCVLPTSCVDGKDIARTVARLRRGWFGVFVTTGYFSEPVQREVIEDEYPVRLVSGLAVAETASILAEEQGCANLRDYLDLLDAEFDGLIVRRRPEEVLHM